MDGKTNQSVLPLQCKRAEDHFERRLRSQRLMCCSVVPWSQGVSLSVTQPLPAMCFGCLPALQQDPGMHQPQQALPAYPWGATVGTEAMRVPRQVTCCLDNQGARWMVGIQGREVLQNVS